MHATMDHAAVRQHKVVRRHSDWTLKEHEVVVSHWPDINTIRSALPHRTRKAIENFAGRCNLRRPLHIWTQVEDQLLRQRVKENVPRKAIADELKLTLNQVANRMAYTGMRYSRRPPSIGGSPIMQEILKRAYELNMSRGDLDEMCRSGSAFRRWTPARNIHRRHLWRAIEEMGGSVVPEWHVQ